MAQSNERMYIRYRCHGEAKIRLVGMVEEIKAQVLNVSLGGCMLCFGSASRFVAGDDLEMSLRVGKTAFQARGWVVPRGHSLERAGIIFASMSPQARTALGELIAELESLEGAKAGGAAAQVAPSS